MKEPVVTITETENAVFTRIETERSVIMTIKTKLTYGTPEWEAALAQMEAANPDGFCWYCTGLLDHE